MIRIFFLSLFFTAQSFPKSLQAADKYLCNADQAATTGFYPKDLVSDILKGKTPEMELSHYPLKKQSSGGGYVIQLVGTNAFVNDLVTDDTYQYRVSLNNKNYLILLREKNMGVEVITIDKDTNLFIQTDAVVNKHNHRSVVWIGSCMPAKQ